MTTLVRLLLGSMLFVAAGYLGRATIIDGESLSLIWPAAGVAGLWIGSGNRATWPVDVAALSGATVLVNLTTGIPMEVATVIVVANVVQVAVFVFLMRSWAPHLWGLGGDRPLARLGDLGRLAIAACLSSLIGLTTGTIGMSVVLDWPDIASLAVWWGRNCVALVVVTTLGILIFRPLAATGGIRAALRTAGRALIPSSLRRLAEAATLVALTVVMSLLLFLDSAAQPLAFLLLVASVWAGIRFAPLAVVVHGLAMGTIGVVITLSGTGPFAAVPSLHYRALIGQAFVAMTVLTGLALAFSRAERDAANKALSEARRAADERAQLLDAVLESMKEGIVVLEDGGKILVQNRAARRLAGLIGEPNQHLQPAATYGLFHDNGTGVLDDELPGRRALAGELVEAEDFHLRTPTVPEGRVLEISAQPLRSPDPHTPRRAMVNLRDVTVDRQHRDALASFAGVVAHDLFHPLSVVDGWTEALNDEFQQGPVPSAVGAPMVARIHRAAMHMREFIADLMSYTIARDQTLRLGPVDLSAVARSLAALRTESATRPLIVVEDGLQVWADSGLVRQLLDNLIGNAVKYVEPGVRPIVEITGARAGDWLEVRVTDNGIGIPEYQREAIFENFHRAHDEGFGGTGLGLAICRRIVDRHGATIHAVPARRGTGSTFVFRLPLLASPPEITAVEPVPQHVV